MDCLGPLPHRFLYIYQNISFEYYTLFYTQTVYLVISEKHVEMNKVILNCITTVMSVHHMTVYTYMSACARGLGSTYALLSKTLHNVQHSHRILVPIFYYGIHIIYTH